MLKSISSILALLGMVSMLCCRSGTIPYFNFDAEQKHSDSDLYTDGDELNFADSNETNDKMDSYDSDSEVEIDSGTESDSNTNDNTIILTVSMSSDDAEECLTSDAGYPLGHLYLDSTDLEMTDDISYHCSHQIIGIRFDKINISPGAIIESAHIKFRADGSTAETTNLSLTAEASDNAATFTTMMNNISERSQSTAVVHWNSIPSWTDGLYYQTPDLSILIQEIVNMTAWNSGNALVIIIEGTGLRRAFSYDNNQSSAPMLQIKLLTP